MTTNRARAVGLSSCATHANAPMMASADAEGAAASASAAATHALLLAALDAVAREEEEDARASSLLHAAYETENERAAFSAASSAASSPWELLSRSASEADLFGALPPPLGLVEVPPRAPAIPDAEVRACVQCCVHECARRPNCGASAAGRTGASLAFGKSPGAKRGTPPRRARRADARPRRRSARWRSRRSGRRWRRRRRRPRRPCPTTRYAGLWV
jgi:hypothetical protein